VGGGWDAAIKERFLDVVGEKRESTPINIRKDKKERTIVLKKGGVFLGRSCGTYTIESGGL